MCAISISASNFGESRFFARNACSIHDRSCLVVHVRVEESPLTRDSMPVRFLLPRLSALDFYPLFTPIITTRKSPDERPRREEIGD